MIQSSLTYLKELDDLPQCLLDVCIHLEQAATLIVMHLYCRLCQVAVTAYCTNGIVAATWKCSLTVHCRSSSQQLQQLQLQKLGKAQAARLRRQTPPHLCDTHIRHVLHARTHARTYLHDVLYACLEVALAYS